MQTALTADAVHWTEMPRASHQRPECHVADRVSYRPPDAIVILEVFKKTTAKTPLSVIDTCKRRLRMYDDD